MKKINQLIFCTSIILLISSNCTIESEVHSPGDFMDCSYKANIFSGKFNDDVVFNTLLKSNLGVFDRMFSITAEKTPDEYRIFALYDTLLPRSYPCNSFDKGAIGVEVMRRLPSVHHKLFLVDCSKDFKFDVEEVDMKQGGLCVRMTFTAKQSSFVDHSKIEDGETLIVEDVIISFNAHY